MPREIRTSIEIAAPPSSVWKSFQQLARGGGQTWLRVDAPAGAKPGRQIDVFFLPEGKDKPYHMTPKVLVNEEGREFRWRGSLPIPGLFNGEHAFRLEPAQNGQATRFFHEESFSGILVPLLGSVIREAESEFKKFNSALKATAESR